VDFDGYETRSTTVVFLPSSLRLNEALRRDWRTKKILPRVFALIDVVNNIAKHTHASTVM